VECQKKSGNETRPRKRKELECQWERTRRLDNGACSKSSGKEDIVKEWKEGQKTRAMVRWGVEL